MTVSNRLDDHASGSTTSDTAKGKARLEPVRLHLDDRLALRVPEVAQALGLSERKVRDLLPELPHLYVGTAIVVPVEPLRDWLRERAQAEVAHVDVVAVLNE